MIDSLETSTFSAPRSALGLIRATLDLYRRFPLLFFVLAAGVVVPYEVIVLAVTGTGPFAQESLGFGVSSLLLLINLVLVESLVSALHVHAVAEVRAGGEPRLVPIARKGLLVLPVVAAATIISWLGISVGFLLFIVPGVILWLRWVVVAQAAAIDRQGWLPALRRSANLTEGNYGHVFALLVSVFLITGVPTFLVGLGFGHHTTTVASFGVAVVIQIVARSFGALATALLFYDLLAREKSVAVGGADLDLDEGLSPATSPSQGPHSIDPRNYSDENRPAGWYVDPSSPRRMRYWGTDDPPGWGGTTRTPRKVREKWPDRE